MNCESSETPQTGCRSRPIAKQLKRVLVWGEESPGNWVPNGGKYQVGDVWWPIWHADDKIFVYTLTRDHSVTTRGIFDVTIDPNSFAFSSFEAFGFPYPIQGFDYDPVAGEFLVSYATGSEMHLVRAHSDAGALAVIDTVLSSTWKPLVAKYVNEGGDVVSYARDPVTLEWGFYFDSKNHSVPDSLLLAIEFNYSNDVHGFDIAGGKLCFGETDATEYKASIKLIDLDGARSPRTVATLDGVFISAGVNQDGTCAIIAQENLRIPAGVIGVLNLVNGEFKKLDGQIDPCFFPLANFGTWNPAGNAFAFTASGFDGEAGQIPSQLWIRSPVACP